MTQNAMIVDHRNVGAAFRRLSLPIAVAMLGDQVLSIVDTIVIGSLGPVALAGATGAVTIFTAIIFAIIGFMNGSGIVAAQRVGAHDLDGFGKTVRAGLVLPVVAAFVAAFLSLPFSRPLIHAMVGHLASADASADYLTIRMFSLVPIAISGALITGLGAAGNRKLGVIILAIINIVHIPLLLVLALGWVTHHPFGIAGAGFSSLLSEAVAAMYGVFYVWRRPVYRVFERSSFDLRLAFECARLGLPEAVFLLAVMTPDAFIVAMLAPLGALTISAFRALNVASDLTFVVPSPLQAAVQTVIGQRLGARDVDGARSFFKRSRTWALWISTATGFGAALLAWPAAYAFTLNATVASLAAWPLAAHMATLPIKGWSMVSMAPIRASGDTRFSMIIGIVTSLLVFPAAYVCIRVLHIGLWGVPVSWIFAWTARAVITAVKLRGESWTRRPLIAA
jgi:putative MATE family efflux protein